MDKEVIIEMLEEIKEVVKNPKSPQIDTSTINHLTAKLQENTALTNGYIEQVGKVLEEVKQPTNTEHRHIIDIQSSWVFFSLIGLSVMLLICGVIIYTQKQTISQSQDNDLKCRRILMTGEATADDLLKLEDLFEYNRDPQEIKRLRKNVEEYERLVKERAERETQAELNAKAAEKLNNEAETVKGRK